MELDEKIEKLKEKTNALEAVLGYFINKFFSAEEITRIKEMCEPVGEPAKGVVIPPAYSGSTRWFESEE